jgi:hypothetical protein
VQARCQQGVCQNHDATGPVLGASERVPCGTVKAGAPRAWLGAAARPAPGRAAAGDQRVVKLMVWDQALVVCLMVLWKRKR